MRLVESFLAVYYTSQVLFVRQLPTNFSAMTKFGCKGPRPLLACDAHPQVNFSVSGLVLPTYFSTPPHVGGVSILQPCLALQNSSKILHYNQNSPDNTGGGWNGFSTLAEFYDLFEGDPNTNYVGDGQEERRGYVPDATTANDQNLGIGYGFLIGLQYNEDGTPLTNRQNQPLVFQKEFPSLVGNGEAEGVRVIKYHPYDPTDEDDQVNSYRQHQIIFRYADAHLMKAEAMMRMGGDPTSMVNDLRGLREDTPDLASVTEQTLLEERARELFIEFWRRNDLVRFGQFTAPWGLKEVSGDENYFT